MARAVLDHRVARPELAGRAVVELEDHPAGRTEEPRDGGERAHSVPPEAAGAAVVEVGEKQMIVAKGFPEPIPAYDLKAIGAPYNLALEELDLPEGVRTVGALRTLLAFELPA